MIRRHFLRGFPLLAGSTAIGLKSNAVQQAVTSEQEGREYWLEMLLKVSEPVLTSLANRSLRKTMPVEAVAGSTKDREQVTHLEAFGRTLCGIAPWLESSDTTSKEDKLRERFTALCLSCVENTVNPSSPDFMNFTKGGQPLVDTAFFAHALLRAPEKLWANLNARTQAQVVEALKSTRIIKPYYSNWLLFSAMIEAALLKFTGEYDAMRIDYALKQHEAWYKGDGIYGDGPDFHFDYYNSFVIHPMMLDITKTVRQVRDELHKEYETFVRRSQRYAIIQERLISPEGTFPPVGRSLAYRCGAFQLLAQVSLQQLLPEGLKPAQVRGAMTAVIRKTLDAPGTFDKNGWLTIGLSGHQPGLGEPYISTGSLYLCTTAFLPLGLSASHEFWTAPPEDWTCKRAFSGQSVSIDKALY